MTDPLVPTRRFDARDAAFRGDPEAIKDRSGSAVTLTWLYGELHSSPSGLSVY